MNEPEIARFAVQLLNDGDEVIWYTRENVSDEIDFIDSRVFGEN